MKTEAEKLKQIGHAVIDKLCKLSKEERRRLLEMSDYHGFFKTRLPESFIVEAAKPSGLSPEDIQVEIVHVERDLTKEIHYHNQSHAFAIILGKKENLEPPKLANAHLDGKWFRVRTGDEINIPSKTQHGFTVDKGGTLYFLSVQSPPIVGDNGYDDYINAN